MPKKLTTEIFIKKSIAKHGCKYDYSNTIFTKTKEKVSIFCYKHGMFSITAQCHLQGQGCAKCGTDRTIQAQKLSKHEYLDKVNKLFNNKYKYNDFELDGLKNTKITIVCPIHGEFIKSADKHLYGLGCPKCAVKNMKTYGTTLKGFIAACENNSGIGTFYVMKFKDGEQTILKHGITARTATQRAKEIPYKPEILLEIKDEPKQIYLFEQLIKQQFKKYKYIPKIKFDGYTECVLLNFPLLIDKDIFENLFKNDRNF